MNDDLRSLIVRYLNEGLSEEAIAERLVAGMPSADFAFRVAAALGHDSECFDDDEHAIQIGVVGDLMIPLARELRKTEQPV